MIRRAAPPMVVGRWGARFLGRTFCCSIGRGGLTYRKEEGDGATPVGVWHMTGGAWRADRLPRPRTALPLAPVGPRDLWSDDPESPAYNQPQQGLWPAFGHERMRRPDPLYDIVLFSDWNTDPVVPGCGSALFIHCWKGARRPTAGCIAFRRADLLWIIRRWDPASRIVVRPDVMRQP